MLAYCSLCVCNLFIRAGNRGRWPASVKLVTLPLLVLCFTNTTQALWKEHLTAVCSLGQIWTAKMIYWNDSFQDRH